jgi:hypothetical protein
MWHFGRDSLKEYSGKDVHVTVYKAQYILERVYLKNIKGKHKLRHEFQEYPNKSVFEAIEDKLNCVDSPSPSNSPPTSNSSFPQLPKIGTYHQSE